MADQRGIYQKFNVNRVDGRDGPGGDREGAVYFVLDLSFDKNAKAAALAYADSCEVEFPALAADLRAFFDGGPRPALVRPGLPAARPGVTAPAKVKPGDVATRPKRQKGGKAK